MFQKVLVANRGEIAVRIVRACRELGIRSVVAYSEADRDSMAVRIADESVCIGPPPASKSYLSTPSVVSAALITGCDAIHPGYGFLAENTYLAEICERVGIVFIGPPRNVIEQMGDKAAAREAMSASGVPVVPGSQEPIWGLERASRVAREVGYPIMLKAVAGGGGRGMRVIHSPEELAELFGTASAEAEAAFADRRMYIEKYIPNPRHVEIQVIGDKHGKTIHLGERDCSIQRRRQKLIEESPAPNISDRTRDAMCRAALKACKHLGFDNVGTFEFLLDAEGHFYFLEMNTRIQVEHPVTEMVMGLDLVKWQLRVAAGERLLLDQKGVKANGHAIECRIIAEDFERGFTPQSGTVDLYLPPGGPGIRVDSHLYSGYTVPPHYDSLLAKFLAWGETREEARKRMLRALEEAIISGITTTIPFHALVFEHPKFIDGKVSTDFIEEHIRP